MENQMRYSEDLIISHDMIVQKELKAIAKLEDRLFSAIAQEQSSKDDSQKNYLNKLIDSLQNEYSRTSI